MASSTTSADLLVALAGSALFWLTVSGIAIRALRIDFAKLEAFLKHLYERTDSITFSASAASRTAVTRTLHTLYGSRILRAFSITLMASLILNIYIVILFHSDWSREKQYIAVLEKQTIATVNNEYSRLTTSEAGRQKLDHALEQVISQAGAFYAYDDPEDKHIRAVYEQFQKDLDTYALQHDISYDLTLSRFFGDSFLNLSWRHGQYFNMIFLLIFIVLCSAVVDTLAVLATIQAVGSILNQEYRQALLSIVALVLLFGLSLLNYGEFFFGYEATTFTIFVCGGIIAFYGSLVVWVLKLALTYKSVLSKSFTSLCGITLLGLFVWLTWYAAGVNISTLIPIDTYRHAVSMCAEGIDRKAVMMSMATILPLIAVLSIMATIYLAKAIMVATKNVILGQVYGASVVSGSTYFLGFLTTLISSTTVAYFLMKLLSHPKH
jgi:predicted phage tail protein